MRDALAEHRGRGERVVVVHRVAVAGRGAEVLEHLVGDLERLLCRVAHADRHGGERTGARLPPYLNRSTTGAERDEPRADRVTSATRSVPCRAIRAPSARLTFWGSDPTNGAISGSDPAYETRTEARGSDAAADFKLPPWGDRKAMSICSTTYMEGSREDCIAALTVWYAGAAHRRGAGRLAGCGGLRRTKERIGRAPRPGARPANHRNREPCSARRAAPSRPCAVRTARVTNQSSRGCSGPDRVAATAAASSSMPAPVRALTACSGIVSPGRARPIAPRRSARARCARSATSHFVTTITSGASIRPAFRCCTVSPASGCSSRYVASATWRMSSSDWPTPSVSTSTRSNRRRSARTTGYVVGARPPDSACEACERMNTRPSGTRIRVRSPSSAPPVTALDGSTATIAMRRSEPAARLEARRRAASTCRRPGRR